MSSLLRVKCRRTGRCRWTKESGNSYPFSAVQGRVRYKTRRTGMRSSHFFLRQMLCGPLSNKEVFCFMSRTKEREGFLERLAFSPTLLVKPQTHKIAYIGVMTALAVVVNMLEIKLTVAQFSFTMFFSVFIGVVLGAGSGFCACFLGDLIGFLIHPMGEYSPWIGISTGLMAFITAIILLVFSGKKYLHCKLTIACVLIFFICTCGITARYLNLVWYSSMSFWEYLTMRLFAQGQIWNSVANSVMAVSIIPLIVKIKPLKINL